MKISLDADARYFAITNDNGFFELGLQDVNGDGQPDGLPAPEFFVHIDGSTAIGAPDGTVYATLGKPFHTVPGQRVQLEMPGAPDVNPNEPGDQFHVYLPPMAMGPGDVTTLNPNADTIVGFGPYAQQQIRLMFPPDEAETIIANMKVTYPAGSAMNEDGTPATLATVIPVDPSRLPAPLPPGVNPRLVISVQAGTDAGFNLAGGSTNFDVPAPVTFPNLDNLGKEDGALIWSFDHDAGRWVVIGNGRVNEGATAIVSGLGVGILAPGWHFVTPGGEGGGCQPETVFKLEFFSVLPTVVSIVQPTINKLHALADQMEEIRAALIAELSDVAKLRSDYEQGIIEPGAPHFCDQIADHLAGIILLQQALGFLADAIPDIVAEVREIRNVAEEYLDNVLSEYCITVVDVSECLTEILERICVHQDQARTYIDNLEDYLGDHLVGLDAALTGSLQVRAVLDEINQLYCLTPTLHSVAALLQSEDGLVQLFDQCLQLGNAVADSLTLAVSGVQSSEAFMSIVALIGQDAAEVLDTHYLPRNGWYAIISESQLLRGRLTGGAIPTFVLPAHAAFEVLAYDPARNRIASYSGTMGNNGSFTVIPILEFQSVAGLPDTDRDGLVDVAEEAIGTSISLNDTDGDGISDLAEVL